MAPSEQDRTTTFGRSTQRYNNIITKDRLYVLLSWVFDSPFGGVSADNDGDFFIYKPLTKTTLSSSIPKETHINNNNIQPIKAWKFQFIEVDRSTSLD